MLAHACNQLLALATARYWIRRHTLCAGQTALYRGSTGHALHASLSLLLNLKPHSLPKSSGDLTDHGCLAEQELEAELSCFAIRRGVSSTGVSKDVPPVILS